MTGPRVIAVCRSPGHTMSKDLTGSIRLIDGFGIEGDAHAGATVKHRSRVARDAAQPNLRQVHLIHAELFEELRAKGFTIRPGQMGENITTAGIDLLALPRGTRLALGPSAIVEVTGLRNPCIQLEGIGKGLMEAVLERRATDVVRKAGVMGIVVAPGDVSAGDMVGITLPPEPHAALAPV